MSVTAVRLRKKFRPARLVEPPPSGHVRLAPAVESPPGRACRPARSPSGPSGPSRSDTRGTGPDDSVLLEPLAGTGSARTRGDHCRQDTGPAPSAPRRFTGSGHSRFVRPGPERNRTTRMPLLHRPGERAA